MPYVRRNRRNVARVVVRRRPTTYRYRRVVRRRPVVRRRRMFRM